MSEVLFCSVCSQNLSKEKLLDHVEKTHAGPRRESLYELCCGNCEYRIPDTKSTEIIKHCYRMKHCFKGVELDWNKFVEKETSRIKNVIASAVELLEENQVEQSPSAPAINRPTPLNVSSDDSSDEADSDPDTDFVVESRDEIFMNSSINADQNTLAYQPQMLELLTTGPIPGNVDSDDSSDEADSVPESGSAINDHDESCKDLGTDVKDLEHSRTVHIREQLCRGFYLSGIPPEKYLKLECLSNEISTKPDVPELVGFGQKQKSLASEFPPSSFQTSAEKKDKRTTIKKVKEIISVRESHDDGSYPISISESLQVKIQPEIANNPQPKMQTPSTTISQQFKMIGNFDRRDIQRPTARKQLIFKCHKCEKSISAVYGSGKQDMMLHTITHTSLKFFQCRDCNKELKTPKPALLHKRKKGCKSGARETMNEAKRSALRKELTHCFPGVDFEEFLLLSTTVGNPKKDARQFDPLYGFKKRTEPAGKWDCTMCPRNGIVGLATVMDHIMYHSGLKPFQCDACRHFLASRPLFTKHLRSCEEKGSPEGYTVILSEEDRNRIKQLLWRAFPQIEWIEQLKPGKKLSGIIF